MLARIPSEPQSCVKQIQQPLDRTIHVEARFKARLIDWNTAELVLSKARKE